MVFEKLRVAALVLCGLCVLGFGSFVAAQQATGKDVSGRPRDGAMAGRNDSPGVLQVVGRTDFNPDAIVKIHPRFDCLVERVLVHLGQRVKRGDPLVEAFSADLAAAKNDFQMASVQHDRDRRISEQKSRLAAENAISHQALIDSRNDEMKSRLAAATAKEKLRVMGVTDREIEDLENANASDRTERARMTVRSRVDGVVIQRDVVPGNQYDRNDTLLTIAQDDFLRVIASVDGEDAHKVKVGQKISVRFAFEDGVVEAKVDRVFSGLDQETQKTKILATIPNPDHTRKADMIVRVAIAIDAGREPVNEPGGPKDQAIDATMRDRLRELERKVDRLLGEKDERTSHAKILERLEALERKLDQVLNGRR